MSAADFDRHFAPLLRPLAPRQSKLHRASMEEQRIAADLAYNKLKNGGDVLRSEIDRSHQAELNAGVQR
jgi:hypothetical protein